MHITLHVNISYKSRMSLLFLLTSIGPGSTNLVVCFHYFAQWNGLRAGVIMQPHV